MCSGQTSPHPTIQDRRPVIQIDFAFMSAKEQPGDAAIVFTSIDVRAADVNGDRSTFTNGQQVRINNVGTIHL